MTVSLRMTASQRDNLNELGGAAWVREQIDAAKEFMNESQEDDNPRCNDSRI